jgi:hypothetical protein
VELSLKTLVVGGSDFPNVVFSTIHHLLLLCSIIIIVIIISSDGVD